MKFLEAPKGGMKVGGIKDPLSKDSPFGITFIPPSEAPNSTTSYELSTPSKTIIGLMLLSVGHRRELILHRKSPQLLHSKTETLKPLNAGL